MTSLDLRDMGLHFLNTPNLAALQELRNMITTLNMSSDCADV
jgi:hypothetical protein